MPKRTQLHNLLAHRMQDLVLHHNTFLHTMLPQRLRLQTARRRCWSGRLRRPNRIGASLAQNWTTWKSWKRRAIEKSSRSFNNCRNIKFGSTPNGTHGMWAPPGAPPKSLCWAENWREGGQAEVFEVENRCTKKIEPRFVLKVFKEGYSVRALQHQWPQGILECGFLTRMVVRAGMVLDDDRFACLLLRCHIDLRKLIDIPREEDSPLWEAKRRPFQDFRTYELRTPRHGLDPKPIFQHRCALNIMNHIAWDVVFTQQRCSS